MDERNSSMRPEDYMNISRLAPAFLVVLGISCGGGDSPGGGEPVALEAFTETYCDILKPCCAQANLPSTGAQCRAFIGAFGSAQKYDPQAGGDCLAETRAAVQAGKCGSATLNTPACDRVFAATGGTKQPGEACTEDGDCAPSPEGNVDCTSSYSPGAETRQCQVRIKGKEGDNPCVGTVEGGVTIYYGSGNTSPAIPPRGYLCHVDEGLFCDSSTRACTRIKNVGAPCTGQPSHECVATAYCDTVSKACAERKPVGAACTSILHPQCVEGAYCHETMRTCALQGDVGAACTRREQCRIGPCVNGKCEKGSSSDLGLVFLCGAN